MSFINWLIKNFWLFITQTPFRENTCLWIHTYISSIVGRGFLTPLIFRRLPYIANPLPLFFKFSPTVPRLQFVVCSLWLDVSSRHICVFLLNDAMDLNLLSLATLVLAALCCLFYATRDQMHWIFEIYSIVSANTLIWYHKQANTHTWHTWSNTLT